MPLKQFFILIAVAGLALPVSSFADQPDPKPTAPSAAKLQERDRLLKEALALKAAAKWDEALRTLEQVLTLEKEALGPVHAEVANTHEQMAAVHERREDFAAAGKARAQVLSLRGKLFGEKNWQTVNAKVKVEHTQLLQKLTLEQRQKLAEADRLDAEVSRLGNDGKSAQAVPLALQAVDIRKQLQGEKNAQYAKTLKNLGWMYREQRDYAKAEPLYRQALAIQKEVLGEEHPDYALTLNNLGWLHEYQRNYAKAEPLFQQALAVYGKTVGEKHRDYATSLNNLALFYERKGEYAKAEPFYQKVLDIRKQVLGEKHRDYATSLNNLATLKQNQGEYAKAEPLFQQALEIRRQVLGEKHPHFATSLNNLAYLYRTQGDYEKAEPLYKQALKIYRQVLGEKHREYATSLNNLASLYLDQGDYAKAEPLYKQAMEIRRQVLGEKHYDFAGSLNDLAILYWSQRDFVKAEPLYKQALEIYRHVLGEKHPDFANSLNNLAHLYWSQGDDAKAEPMYKQALEIRRQALGVKHPHFANSLNSLAALYAEQKDYAKAEPMYKEALDIRRQVLGVKHPQFAISLNNLANLYAEQKEYTKAEPMYKQALEIRRQVLGVKHPDFANSLLSLAELYLDQKDYANAEPLYKQALEIRRQALGEKHTHFAVNLNKLASLYHSRGDSAKAEPLSRQSVLITQEHLEHSSLVQSERQQFVHRGMVEERIANYLGITAKLPTSTPSTYDVMLSWKGSVTTRQRMARLARTSLASDPQAKQLFDDLESLSRQIKLWSLKSPEKLPKGIDLPKKLVDLSEQREQVEAKLSARTEAFRNLRASQKLTSAELQKLLPEGTVLVDFVVYGEELAAFVVTRDQLHRVELGKIKPFAEAVDGFRGTLKRGRPLLDKDDPARVLRAKLLDPLDKHLAGAKLVLIAADGPLNQLPFAALPGKKEGTYLLEEVALAITPVPQMLPELLAKRDPARADTPPSLLALGDVDFEANPIVAKESKTEEGWKRRRAGTPQNWKRLPGTLGEVLSIEDTFRKAVPKGKLTVLREGQATEAAVRKLAGQHEYLHFATHGFFASEEVKSALQFKSTGKEFADDQMPKAMGWHPGLLSGIVLAGANKPKDDDDGVLTALEVGELDLSRVELAVLSACETGLGEVAGGEGVLGLQRAFQTAGARTVVTSLWKVDDEATRKLMERFYENYWKKEMGTLEALREAQLWMLREGATRGVVRETETDKTRRAPPHYWAAFVLSGDWR